jgi:alpha-tubulin suppressor-like RCC1 family protein
MPFVNLARNSTSVGFRKRRQIRPSGPFLYAWGAGSSGQLGLDESGAYARRSNPVRVGTQDDWASVSGGSDCSFSIKTNGTLWAWGNNGHGKLGLGDTTGRSSPTQVGLLADWLSVTGGTYSTVAVKTNGTLWAWGRNQMGELGLGNTTAYNSPKQVGALTTWSFATVKGTDYCIAVKTDGTLWAWGNNQSWGHLGLGDIISRSSPVQVGALTDWTNKIAICQEATAVIKTNGTLWVWGRGYEGNLGLNNTSGYYSPVQLGALTNWLSISGAYRCFYSVKTDGTIWAWGSNVNGQLGFGNLTSYSSPKQIGALTSWSLSSAGGRKVVATKTDGTIWSWGANTTGQLGLGNITNYSSPKQIGALTSWVSVSSGPGHVLALAL